MPTPEQWQPTKEEIDALVEGYLQDLDDSVPSNEILRRMEMVSRKSKGFEARVHAMCDTVDQEENDREWDSAENALTGHEN